MIFLGGTYDSFHVTLSEPEDGVCLVKAMSKIGMAETQTKLLFDEKKLDEKLNRFALLAQGATPVEGELREFGQELHKMLFHDAVWDLYKKSKAAAEHVDGLLIELDIQSPKLSQIPWELLHDGTDFLGLSRKTPVTRSVHNLGGETASEVKPIELPLRMLFAAAKPLGQAPLNLGHEIRQVCGSLQEAMQEGAVTFHPALGEEVQSDRFSEALRVGGYHILHISTHGTFVEQLDRGFLLLQDGMNEAAPLAIDTLAGMIRDTSIQLVCLDACETAAGSSLSGNLLRSGANAALAMRFPIREDLAARFFGTFYRRLMEGDPIWCSIVEARIVLRDPSGRDTIDWAIPVLYTRDSYTPTITGTRQPLRRYYISREPARFVGREQQLDELTEKLLQPSTRSVVVHGFGGIGKSTFIQKALSEIYLLFQDTCYVDCRGITDILTVIPQINSMLSVHGLPLVDKVLSGLSESGKIEYLVSQLDKGKFLLTLDNIDEMQGEPPTTQFLSLVDNSATIKMIASCRIPDAPLGHQRQERMDALNERYALSLIREVGRDIPQICEASDSDLRRVNEKLRGHPLSIVIAVPYFDGEPFESVLEDLPARVGSGADIAQGILAWSYAKLSPNEQRFLENVSVFYGHVPMEAMLNINDGKEREILVELVRKNMIEFSPTTNLYALHPRLHEYAYAKLGGRTDYIQIKAAEEIAPKLAGRYWSEAMQLYSGGVESARKTSNRELAGRLLLRLSNMHHRMGNYDKAKKCLEDTLETAKETNDESLEATALYGLGSVEYSRNNYPGALRLYSTSLEMARKLGIQRLAAAALHQLAMIEHQMGNDPEAGRLHNEAKAAFAKLGDQSGIAATLHELAMIEQRKGDYPEAKRLHSEARDIFAKLGDQSGIAAALHELAVIEHRKGNHPDAVRLYHEAKTMFEELGDQSGIAATLGQLGTIEEDRGNYDEAKRLYNESLAIERKLGSQSGIAKAMYHLGCVESSRGNYDEAVRLYNESLRISRELGEQSGMAVALDRLAVIEQCKGNYPESKTLYNKARDIFAKLGDQSGMATTLHGLAVIEQQEGNYDEAKRLYNESLRISRELGEQSGIASTLHELAMIDHRKGNYPEAKRLYDQSLEIKRRLGDQYGIAVTLHQLGMVEQHRGDYEEARRLFDQSLEIKRKLGDRSGIAGTLHQLAIIEQNEGNYGGAARLYNESLRISRELGDQSGIAATLHGLAVIEQQEGNYDEAKKLFDQSLEIARKLGQQSGMAATLYQLGQLAEKNDPTSAERFYQQALDVFEKLGEKLHIETARKDLERILQLKQKP